MTAAGAIAWELRRRHRWGLTGIAAYLVAVGAYKLWTLRAGRFFTMDDPEQFALLVAVPMSCSGLYLLSAFTYGVTGDFAARESMYPRRMLTLPVTTNALVGWPMLYGSITMALMWAGLRAFGVWPADTPVPYVWPAVLGAALLAWSQAATWMPYGLRGLRVIAALLVLAMIEVLAVLGLHFRVPEPAMLAMLTPLLPAAVVVARIAVGRARHGDVPDWRGALTWRATRASKQRFDSAHDAQVWFEFQRAGWQLPALVGLLLPFELLLLWVADNALSLTITILIGVLITPPFMASFAAATVRKASSDGSDSHSISPFVATRPLTSASLIAAKLTMTMWSTLLAWLLVIAAVPIALVWSDMWPFVSERARYFTVYWGAPRALTVLLVILGTCVLSTWRQLVQSLFIGLSGREWLVRWSVAISLILLSLVAPVVIWIVESDAALRFLLEHFKLMLGLLATAKMSLATWVAVLLWRSRVLSDRALLIGVAIWLGAVLTLYGVFSWVFIGPQFPRYMFGFVAILIVPLVRLSAAPLALDRNRHG